MQGGQVLGDRYEVRGLLGRGGMAEVHDGWDHRLDRPVAIKTLHPGPSDQTEIRQRFEDEARSAAALSHPHIVGVHDCGEHDGEPYIVMERLPGNTLGDEVAQGPLPQARVYEVLDHVLSALAAAHAYGIVHRDIKPANILVTESGDAIKVADFGIAKSPTTAHTATGQLVGTIAYLSPERLHGAPASVADDLYAVGVVGYEAVAGQRPFAPDEEVGPLVRAILYNDPPPLRTVRPDVDPALAAVIDGALAQDPHRRFGSAEEMRAALHGRQPVSTDFGTATPALQRIESPIVRSTVAVPAPVATTTILELPATSFPRGRRRKSMLIGAAAIPVVFAVAGLGSLLDSSAAQPRTTTEPVTYSSPAHPPVLVRQLPPAISSPAPDISSAPPNPTAQPVIVQANDQPAQGGGNGNGKKGNGPRKAGGPKKP
jgi:serine/threonine protein kinase